MRPLASLAPVLALVLALSGCGTIAGSPFEGFGGFIGDTHTWDTNPHLPMTQSETISRVMGKAPEIEPLAPETGNVWPGPVAPSATLDDVARLNPDQLLKPDGEITLPGSVRRSAVNPLPPSPAVTPAVTPSVTPAVVTPSPVAGSSKPPAPPAPPAPAPVAPPPPAPVAAAPAAATVSAPRIVQTPTGPATISGGTGVVTYTDSKGNTGLVVPNGNGTSTLIAPDGSVQTVPTPN